MTRHTSITLGPHFLGLVEDQMASGRFATASEGVRAGLRQFEEQEERRAAPAAPLDLDAFLAGRAARVVAPAPPARSRAVG